MERWLGTDSLRYALTAASALGGWAALHYVMAGRTLAVDIVPEVGRASRDVSGRPTARDA